MAAALPPLSSGTRRRAAVAPSDDRVVVAEAVGVAVGRVGAAGRRVDSSPPTDDRPLPFARRPGARRALRKAAVGWARPDAGLSPGSVPAGRSLGADVGSCACRASAMVTPSARPTRAADVPAVGSDKVPGSVAGWGSLKTRAGRSAAARSDRGQVIRRPRGGLDPGAGSRSASASDVGTSGTGKPGTGATDGRPPDSRAAGGAGSSVRGVTVSTVAGIAFFGRGDVTGPGGATCLTSLANAAALASDRSAAARAAAVISARLASSSGVAPVSPVAAVKVRGAAGALPLRERACCREVTPSDSTRPGPRRPGTQPTHPASLRSAAAGCIWTPGRNGPVHRS